MSTARIFSSELLARRPACGGFSTETAMGGDDVDRSAVRAERSLNRLAVSDITAANSPDGAHEVPLPARSTAHVDGSKSEGDRNPFDRELVTAGRDRHLNSESLVTVPRPAKQPEAGNNPSPVSGAYSPWRAHRPHLEPMARRASV